MLTIQDIAARLSTQDNRCTNLPIFVVEQRKRIYGFDADYADETDIAWLYSDECVEVTEDEARACRAHYEETGDELNGYRRVAFQDTWVFVTSCLTEEGAKAYIAVDGHNLTAPRIYVHSGYRNTEWETIREFLLSLAKDAP